MADQTCQGLAFRTLAGKVSVPSSLKWHGAGPLQPPKSTFGAGSIKMYYFPMSDPIILFSFLSHFTFWRYRRF